jgi:hypothetical protein
MALFMLPLSRPVQISFQSITVFSDVKGHFTRRDGDVSTLAFGAKAVDVPLKPIAIKFNGEAREYQLFNRASRVRGVGHADGSKSPPPDDDIGYV